MRPVDIAEPRFRGKTCQFLSLLAVAWFFLVFIRYFSRPIDLPSLIGMFSAPMVADAAPPTAFLRIQGESVLVTALAALALLALTGLGVRIARSLGIDPQNPVARFPLHLGLGIAGANALWIGLGLNNLWHAPLLLAAFSALVIQALPVFAGKWSIGLRDGRDGLVRLVKDSSWTARLMLAVTSVYLAVSLGHGLVPETFYDSMVYHLAVPSYWLLNHGIRDFPTNFFSNYPYGGEMFFFNGLQWGPLLGSGTAKILNGVALAAAAKAAYDWIKDMTGDPDMSVMAGALVLTTPLLTMNVWSTQLEGLLALFLILFLRSLQGKGGADPLAAGIFAGTALSVKYTAILGIGAGCLAALLVHGVQRDSWKRGAWMLGAAVPGVAPWVIKNFSFTGNPFYPYGMQWFTGRHLPETGYARLLAEQREIHAGPGFLIPWKLVMSEPVGPMLLALVPGIVLLRSKKPVLRFLALTVLFFFASALAVTHHMRFLLAGFVMFYLLAAAALSGAARWVRKAVLAGAVVSGILGFVSLSNISRHYYSCGGIWQGKESREAYLRRVGVAPYYDLPAWVNRNLPADSVVLLAGDARGLYYARRFLTQTVFDDPFLSRAVRDGLDVEGILVRLREMGVTHLAVNGEEGLRSASDYRHYELNAAEWGRLDDFMRRGLDPLAFLGLKTVYRVRDAAREKTSATAPNLLPLFSNAGTRYVKAAGRGDWVPAMALADEALALCPGLSFWWEQKAMVAVQMGRPTQAGDWFREAEGRGGLQPDGYRLWLGLLEANGRRKDAARVKRYARERYPGAF